MHLTKIHIGVLVKRNYWEPSIKYFKPRIISSSSILGTTYYLNGKVIENDLWTNDSAWELWQSPTTDFILED